MCGGTRKGQKPLTSYQVYTKTHVKAGSGVGLKEAAVMWKGLSQEEKDAYKPTTTTV